MRREVLQSMTLESNGFGIEPELTAKVARMQVDGHKCRVYEVPISYFGRDFSEGKKIGIKDGFEAIWCILRFNLF